jgi:hypothetical protein
MEFKPKKLNNVIKQFNLKMKLSGGDGGSKNIIHIDTKKKIVYKLIPYYFKTANIKVRIDRDQREILFYKLFTKKIIPKTPHVVGYYMNYKTKLYPIIKDVASIKDVYLKQSNKFYRQLANIKFDYTNKLLKNDMDVCVLEYCPLTINSYLANLKKENILKSITRIIFQMVFTLAVIQKQMPSFVHNDLFLRNVLASEEKCNKNDYVCYIWDKKSFYLPANGIYIKMNDFGYSVTNKLCNKMTPLNKKLYRMPNINCKKCDIFNFLHDFYDGSNQGSDTTSMMKLYKKKAIKSDIVKIFANFLDVKLIDKINKENRRLLNMTWSIYNLPFLQKAVKEPHEYLTNKYFANYLQSYKPTMNIIKTYKA